VRGRSGEAVRGATTHSDPGLQSAGPGKIGEVCTARTLRLEMRSAGNVRGECVRSAVGGRNAENARDRGTFGLSAGAECHMTAEVYTQLPLLR
jgi:hypothetical protein